MGEYNSIKAVHDDDIESYLCSLGVLSKVDSGEAHCFFCGDTISRDNISAILPIEGKIEFCCNNASCSLRIFNCGE